MKKIVILFLFGIVVVFAGTTYVKIEIDSPVALYDRTTNSVNCPVSWTVPTDPDTAQTWWNDMGDVFKLYWKLGELIWDYDSGEVSEPSEFIETFGSDAVAEGNNLRFNFGCYGYLPYQYSSNWRAIVGPLDSTERASALSECGFTDDPDSIRSQNYLPKRFCPYGIPEMIRVAKTLGSAPVFVYMGTCDTTFEIEESFEYTVRESTLTGWHDTTYSTTRKSLYDDAYCFAQYLFGDPATSDWAQLRVIDGCTTAVNSDYIMLGNDVPNAYAMYYSHKDNEISRGWYLYDYVGDSIKDTVNLWPQFPITDTLFPGLDTLFDFSGDTIENIIKRKYRNQYAYRYRARLDTVAAAFKDVKPNIKVSAYTFGSSLNSYYGKPHGLLLATLAAKNIDSYGFNNAMSGGHWDGNGEGHNDWDMDNAHLNYNNTTVDFMSELDYPDNLHSNRFLVNESLGDLILQNRLDHYFENTLPVAVDTAKSIFYDSTINSDKPVDISEYERHYGFRWNDDSTSKRFNSEATIANGIKFIEVKRKWNQLRSEYNLGGLYAYNLAPQRRGMYWGIDSLQRAEYDSVYGPNMWHADCGNFYPLDNWDDSAETMGIFPSLYAQMLYKDIGLASLSYILDSDPANALDDTVHRRCGDLIGDLIYEFINRHDNPSFYPSYSDTYSITTADPYVSQDGHISVVVVNRDTTKTPPEMQAITCSLETVYEGFQIDSFVIAMPVIDTTVWKTASYNIYGDSTFLPLGFAHNGFTYDSDASADTAWKRYIAVTYDTFNTDIDDCSDFFETNSSTYFTIELEPLMFAKVDAYPHKDSVEITLHRGWNHLSIPLYTGETTLYELFHERRCLNFACSVGVFYEVQNEPNEPGKSYLVAHPSSTDTTFYISGVPCYKYITPVYENESGTWFATNMIGSVFDTACFIENYLPSDIASMPEFVWHWDQETETYDTVQHIIPTYGCWLDAEYQGDFAFPTTQGDCLYTGISGFSLSSIRHLPNFPDTANDSTMLGIPADSLHLYFDVDWSNNKIAVLDKSTSNYIERAMVVFIVGDSVDIQYTDTAGSQNYGIAESNLDIGDNDSTWVLLFKQGYYELLIHPYGTVENGDTMWGDVYIYGDITISSGDTLTVLPGTNIYAAYRSDALQTWMADRIDIVNQGHIIAVGDSSAPIMFTVDVPADSTPAPSDWKGIVHHYNGSGEYEHCRFEYMRYFQGHQPGGDVSFKDCTFAHSYAYAITYGNSRPAGYDKPTVTFEDCDFDTIGVWNGVVLYALGDSSYMVHCIFDSCASYVFDVKDSSVFEIEACSLNNCYGALIVSDDARVDFTDCDLRTSGSWMGWKVENAGTLNVENSIFSKGCSGKGPMVYNDALAEFRYCSIADFTSDAVSCDSGFVDLGTGGDFGHNCIWSDNASATRLHFGTKSGEFYAHGNWIDTLIFGGVCADEIDTGSFFPPDSCDTTVAKVIAEPEDTKQALPIRFELGAAIPNPFNSTVSFDYTIPYDCEIEVIIFDLLGKSVCVLFEGNQVRGTHRVFWSGRDDSGEKLPSGTYLYRLKSDDFEETRKMTLIK